MAAAPLTVEMLFLPNTVGVVRGAPHADSAQKLFDWLRQAQVTEFLVSHGALEGAVCPAGESVKSPDWAAVLHDLDQANSQQKLIFLQ